MQNYAGQNLSGQDFSGQDLKSCNFEGADLEECNFENADLSGANLERANLEKANLKGANLSFANLCSTTNLRGANLKDAFLIHKDHPNIIIFIEKGLIEKVAQVVINNPELLNMEEWHCGTTHCIAGWAVELSPNGKYLEEHYGTRYAGLFLLGSEAYPHFWGTKKETLKYLKRFI